MAYKKHTWGSGIPNRNKFEEMDNAIESVAPSNDGTNGQVLTKTSTGAKWQNASGGTAGDVTYDSSVTYPNGTVGKEITSLSEKIVNCYDVDTTEEKVVGRYIYMDGAIKKSKPIYRQVLVTNSNEVSTNVGIDLLLKYEVSGKRSGGQIDSIPFYDSNSEYVTVWVSVTDANNSKVKFGIHGVTYTQIISTINYTKTTDTPTVIE